MHKTYITSNALSALCHALTTCGFVVTGNPGFSLLLLLCGVVVTGNPAFSLAEQPSSPKGGNIFVESYILIG